MHPHQATVVERVAVVLGKGALCCGAHVGKYKTGGCFARQPVQIRGVPCGRSRREEAWSRTELGVGIEADAEAICIVLSAAGILDRELHGGWSACIRVVSGMDRIGPWNYALSGRLTNRSRESKDCLRIE